MSKAIQYYNSFFSNLRFATYWGSEENSSKAFLDAAGDNCTPLAVIELTSEVLQKEKFLEQTQRLLSWGARGFIVPPSLLSDVRALVGDHVTLISPGVRLQGKEDHHQPQTPQEARQGGADWVVVGRPILQSSDMKQAILDYSLAIQS